VSLAPGRVGAQEPVAALIRAGDSAWAAGRFPDAKAAYAEALGLDSIASSRSVYRLAVLASWDGELPRAIGLFARYIRMEPQDEEGRIALAKAYAWAGQTGNAVLVYDSILGRDRTYRDAALGAAQALAWAGRFTEALGRYDRWIADNGKDVEAALARARTLAWAGRLREAEAAYDVIVADGEVLEGSKGVALIAAWRGDLFRSEALWRTLVRDYPKDPEPWVGLAQVLRWSGRAEEAGEAIDRALVVAPAHADARSQRRWIAADLAPAVAPGAVYGWDSDGNRTWVASVRTSFRPLRRVSGTLGAFHRDAELDQLTGRSNGARMTARWLAHRRLTLIGEAGITRTHGERGVEVVDRTRAVGAAQANLKVGARASIGAGVSRDVFDETAPLLLSAITVSTVNVEGEVELGSRLSLAAGGHRARLAGGSVPNERNAGFGSLRWRVHRKVVVGLGGRIIGYDESPRDGYFSPERYRHGELFGRFEPRRDLGWTGYLEAGVGRQYVRFATPGDSKGTQRFGAGIVHRPSPGTEVGLDYLFSNVAASGTIGVAVGSVYRYQAVSLRGRIRL
jgi:tetratricopeptide (TPR) repeat protein